MLPIRILILSCLTLLLLCGCGPQSNGRIELRESDYQDFYERFGVEEAYLINTSADQRITFTVRKTEDWLSGRTETETEVITLAPGEEDRLGDTVAVCMGSGGTDAKCADARYEVVGAVAE